MPDLSFDAALEFARALIRIPGAPGAERDVAQRVLIEMNALGFHDVHTDDAGNVIGRAPGRGEKPPVMLNAHLDVVDVGDADTWEHPPFRADVAGGFLHGRGAMDIKGPLALQTYAAAHYLANPGAGDVIVAHTVLEERGGWGMAFLLESGAVRPGAVIIGEATHGDVCIGHRGRAELIVEIQGAAGHASAPERAHNPMDALPVVIPALRRFADALGTDPVLGRSTLAPTALETLPRSRNVIPDRVRIVCDWRVLPTTTADAAVAQLRTHLERVALPEGLALDVRFACEAQHTWTGLAEERRLFTPGFLLDPDHPVVQAAVTSITASMAHAPAVRPWTFATDGGHACGVHGIPCIGFAPGEERFAHTNRERLALDQARAAYAAYPALIAAVQDAL